MNSIPSRGFARKLIAGVLLIDVLLLVFAASHLLFSRNHALQLLHATGNNLTRLLEERIKDRARLIDDALLRMENELRTQRIAGTIDTVRLERVLATERRQLPEIEAIRITDAQGDVISGGRPEREGTVNYADREFFRLHRRHSTSDLIISGPLLGKITNHWILAFTRCSHAPDGSFAGIIAAAVPITSFQEMLSTVELGPGDTVVLRTDKGALIVRYPPLQGPIGQPGSMEITETLKGLLQSDSREANFHVKQAPDGVERTVAFRRLSGYPFTIAVGINDATYLSAWRMQAAGTIALVAVFLLMTTGLARMAIRHLRRREAMEAVHLEDLRQRRILIEQSMDGIVILDDLGGVREANQRFADMLGYPLEETRHLHVWDWDAQWTESELRKMIDTVKDAGMFFETRHRRKDGSIYDVEISTNATWGTDCRLIFCICRDITQRKENEQMIRANAERLRALINSTPDIICFKDGQGRWQEANEAMLAQFSLTNVDYHGKSDAELADHTHPMYQEAFRICEVTNEQAWKQGSVSRGEEIIPCPDGPAKVYDVLKVPIFAEDGGRKGLVVLGRDITELKRAMDESRRLQTQLVQAQKMEAIGTLAGGIAHDFNNILSSILGYAEMALDVAAPGSPLAHDLGKVVEAGQRAASLVRQILDFSRQGQSEPMAVQPAHLIKEVVKLLRSTLPTTIEIDLRLNRPTRPILADPTQFHQIVMNLCTNAFHAMEEHGGILTISLHEREMDARQLQHQPQAQPGAYVILTVADTGCGIAREIQDKIFDPYFTTKEIGRGTGMGLAIVHGIVTAMGGFVHLESFPGQGTTFQIHLPALVDQTPQQLTAGQELIPSGNERILLVDDESMLVEMTRTMLERLGYQVTACHASLEALTLFQQQPDFFQAVVTDLTMPGMTGMELSRQILEIRPDIPILLSTGYSSLIDQEQVRKIGIRGLLKKPITKKEIATLLRGILDGTATPDRQGSQDR